MLTRENARSKSVSVLIQTVKGDIEVTLGTLSIARRSEIIASVQDAKPETIEVVVAGKKETKTDNQSPEFLRLMDEVVMKRNARLIMVYLIEGGNFEDMKDCTLDELEAFALNELDADLFAGVLQAIFQIRNKLSVAVQTAKNNF